MINEEELEKSIFDMLSNNPNFEGRVYLLSLPSIEFKSVRVMYDSMSLDYKQVFIDKKGCYINGRNQGQGDKPKMYLSDFSNYIQEEDWKEFAEKEIDRLSKKPRAISVNKLKIGCGYIEDEDKISIIGNTYTYLGKFKTNKSSVEQYAFKKTNAKGGSRFVDYSMTYVPRFLYEKPKQDGFDIEKLREDFVSIYGMYSYNGYVYWI